MLGDLEAMIAKDEISVTDEEAIRLSKRLKDVPLLDKAKYLVDEQIEKESKMNPLLVKQKPLELPQHVVSHLYKQRKLDTELYKRQYSSISPESKTKPFKSY